MSSGSESGSDQEDKWRMWEGDLGGGGRRGHVYALFVLDGTIPSTMVNKVFQDAFEERQYDALWLAEDYSTIDINSDDPPDHYRMQHCTAVNADWVSPWAGKTLDEVIEFVRNIPNPPTAVNKLFFVVLDKEQYVTHRRLMVYKTVDREAQSLACNAPLVSDWLDGHNRCSWPDLQNDWESRGIVVMQ